MMINTIRYLVWVLMTIPVLSSTAIVNYPKQQLFSNNSTLISQNKAPQKFIDIWTNNIFSSLHPELSGRKIQSSETEYMREWQAIEIVVVNNLTYQMGCTGRGWGLSEYDRTNVRTGERLLTSTVLDKVADAVFYTRHPELGYRKIKPGEYKLTNEWMKIRQAIWTIPWC